MKNYKDWTILKPIKDIYNSLFNNDQGFSFRKVYAVFAMFAAYKVGETIQDDHVKKIVVIAWMVLGAVCIGLVTIPDLIKFLSKNQENTTTTNTKTTTEEVKNETN